MLDSLNKPLNDQPNWNTALSEVLDDEKIKTVTDAAKMLMTLTHVAEAARPKKKTWESWKDVMDEVICLSQSQQETFRKSSHDVFKKQNRRPYETQDEYNTLFEEINRLMADDSNRQIKDSIRHKYPALDVVSSLKEIRSLKRNSRKAGITRLGLDSASPQSAEFLKVLDDKDVSAKEKRNLLEAIPLSEKIYKLLILHAQKNPMTYAQEVYKKAVKLQPAKGGFRKTGCVPGADNQFRYVLQVVVNDEIASIKDATEEYFPMHKKGGTFKERLSIFTL